MTPRQSSLSPSQRSTLIAAVMLLLLVASLGASYLLTKDQARRWALAALNPAPVQVGDLHIDIPVGWSRVDDAPAVEGLSLSRTFADPDEPDRQLVVGLLHLGTPQPPVAALNMGLHLLLGDTPLEGLGRGEFAQIDTPLLTGVRYAALSHQDNGDTQEHYLAAMSEDGRRYWLIYLTQTAPAGDLRPQQIIVNTQLLDAICRSASDTHYHDATGDDLEAAGLVPGSAIAQMPQGVELRAQKKDPTQTVLNLVPTDANQGLRFLRLRGVPDAGATDPADPLSPQSLLIDELRLAGAPAAGNNDVTHEQVGATSVWHADLPHLGGGHETGLTRQLWFARLSPGRGLVIEAVAEPSARPRLAALIPKVIAALANATGTPPDHRPEVEAAISRGVALAAHMRDDLEHRLATAWRYELIQRDDMVIGCAITKTYTPPPDEAPSMNPGESDPMPYYGQSVSILPLTGGETQSWWQCSRDGRHFLIDSKETGGPDTDAATRWSSTRMVCNDGELLLGPDPPGDSKTRPRAQPTPGGLLLPMAMNRWPTDLLTQNAALPAVVWARWGSGPPIAYWLARTQVTTSSNRPVLLSESGAIDMPDPAQAPPASDPGAEDSQPVAQMLLWPMMGMDPTRILLDANGRAVRVDRRHQSRTPADPDEVSYCLVDRAKLLEQFPKLRVKLDELEQKGKSP